MAPSREVEVVAPPLVAQVSAPTSRRWTHADQWMFDLLVVLLVLTQRIGIPVGGTAVGVALPLTYVVLGVLIARRKLAVNRLRAELYLLAASAALVASAAVDMRGGTLSVSSLNLLLVIYLPWVLRVADDTRQLVVLRAGRTFLRLMLVLASIGVVQMATQLAGVWHYQDLLAQWLPPNLLIPGYNTNNPLSYGSNVIKGNAFIFLEPSALSQYCALAIVIGLMLRVRTWQLLLLVAGLASAVSGTGILLLAGSGILVLFRAPGRIRPAYVIGLACAVVAVLLSPVAPAFLNRTGEVNQPSSSGYARFVAPYETVSKALVADPIRYVTGAGAGNAERMLSSNNDGTLFSIVPKLAFEYGIVAGGIFVLFLLLSMLDRPPWRVVPGALVILTFFLQGGLLQPQTAFLAWTLTAAGSRENDAPPPAELPPI